MSEARLSVPSGELLILMYHHVGEPPPGAMRGLYVTPRQLGRQIAWLRNQGAQFTTFTRLEHGDGLVHPWPWYVILTFDDGHLDVYERGMAVFAEQAVPAVVYPVVGSLGHRGLVWEENEDHTPVDILSESEVADMAARGIEFGSHLLTHRHATRLPPEALAHELSASRQRLMALTGQPCPSVAYPFGSVSGEVTTAAREAGYRYGLTTEPGPNAGADALRLRRLAVRGTRPHHFWRFKAHVRRWLAAVRAADSSRG